MSNLPPPPPPTKEDKKFNNPMMRDSVIERQIELTLKDGDEEEVTKVMASEKPNIESAETFGFETLSLRVKDKGEWRLSKPGEGKDEGASLFPYIGGREALTMIDEFGVGISLYFRQLLSYALIFFVCGFIYIPAMMHMTNDIQKDKDNSKTKLDGPSSAGILQGSALWAKEAHVHYDGSMLGCSLACFCFLLICTIIMEYAQEKLTDRIDDANLTTQDYAIRINNPPQNLKDPEAYKNFFSEWGDVVYCTIVLNNGELLQTLNKKNSLVTKMKEVKDLAARDGELDEKEKKAMEKAEENVHALTDKINELTAKEYKVNKVFICLNKEEGKRRCLNKFALSWVQKKFRKGIDNIPKLEGVLLDLDEPTEPSEVFYFNTHFTHMQENIRDATSWIVCGVVLVVCFFLLQGLTQLEGTLASVGAAIINLLLPMILKGLSVNLEVHQDQGDLESSMFLKLIIVRCFNSALLTKLVLDDKQTTSYAAINQIASILIADAFTGPIVKVLMIGPRIKRAIVKNDWFGMSLKLAPTQRAADNVFAGMPFSLGERYTDICKTLFVGLFYSPLLPQGLFITSLAMLSNFFSDRYMLLRAWRKPKRLDGSVASASSKVFIAGLIFFMISQQREATIWPYTEESIDVHCILAKFWCIPKDESAYVDGNAQYEASLLYFIFIWVALIVLVVKNCLWDTIMACTESEEDIAGKCAEENFRDIADALPFVPTIDNPLYAEPFLACSLYNISDDQLPVRLERDDVIIHRDDINYNNAHFLPDVKDAETRNELFSSVHYFN